MPALPTHQSEQTHDQAIDDALGDVAILERSLADEVAQLEAVRAPGKEPPVQMRYGGKAIWWWRFKLMTWIHMREACSDSADDLLRGLRLSLKQWSDVQLLQFLKYLGRVSGQRQPQRRGRSA